MKRYWRMKGGVGFLTIGLVSLLLPVAPGARDNGGYTTGLVVLCVVLLALGTTLVVWARHTPDD